MDSKIEHFAVDSFISVDNFESAKIAGKHIVTVTNEEGVVLIITGNKEHINAIDRRAGVIDEVEKGGMKSIVKYTDWNNEEVTKIVNEELDKDNNNISAIFVAWDTGILKVFEILKERDLETEIILVGFDGISEVIKKIESADISATIAQPIEIMARDSIESIISVIEKKINY